MRRRRLLLTQLRGRGLLLRREEVGGVHAEETLRDVVVHCVVTKEVGTSITVHLEDGTEGESWRGRDLGGCREMRACCGMQTALCEAEGHRR